MDRCALARLPLPARREYMTGEAALRGLRIAVAAYPAGMLIGEHAHDKPSITVIAGGGLVELGHRGAHPTACGHGMVVVRPAGEPHANRIAARGVVNLELELEPALLEAGGLTLARAAATARPQVGLLASRLRLELAARDPAHTLLVEGLALEIVALSLAGDPVRRRSPPAWLARAYDRIRAGFRAPLDIATLARDAGVHPVHFSRLFRRAYGTSPGELVHELRLDWAAAELIRHPSRPIALIATDAGYYDQSHFTRRFKARLGHTPHAYRSAARP